MLHGHQSQSEQCKQKKNLLFLLEIKPAVFVQPTA
jgi:hypothetical protein